MAYQKDYTLKNKKNEHSFKTLPSDVLMKARNTLHSITGVLKSRHSEDYKISGLDSNKDKRVEEFLKTPPESEFIRNLYKARRRSRIDETPVRYKEKTPKPRPLSVGAVKRQQVENDLYEAAYPKTVDPPRRYESVEDVCIHSSLMLPVVGVPTYQNEQEKPRKKLSFRDPEIVGFNGTVPRSHKLMGITSLNRKPNNMFYENPERHSPCKELASTVDFELESQAMRIVRTVGQAFEVCHKLQNTCPDGAAASTSSAVEEPPPSDRVSHHTFREVPSDVNASDVRVSSVVASVEPLPPREDRFRVAHPTLELLPPPPRKENRRVAQSLTPTPTINLPEFPECITKVDIIPPAVDEEPPQNADQHQVKLLREKLEQQAQQTRAAVAQLLLLRDQLAAEQAARYEAQSRTHQLLVHNKELLEHITALVTHLQERERGTKSPINAQQLTLLPQGEGKPCQQETLTNGNQSIPNTLQTDAISHESLIDFITQGDNLSQNIENNNLRVTQGISPSTSSSTINGGNISFQGMSNDQIQKYLITKFQTAQINEKNDQNGDYNKQYFQNSKSFPHIPPLSNHFSSMDLASLLKHNAYGNGMDIVIDPPDLPEQRAKGLAQSQNSIYSSSPAGTSKDSTPDILTSDDALQFIMPLSHKTILKTTCPDGRTKLIVPVSPSGSHSDITELKNEASDQVGDFLRVPEAGVSQGGPITRASSEKVPNSSEMMTALRSQWTRHTTK